MGRQVGEEGGGGGVLRGPVVLKKRVCIRLPACLSSLKRRCPVLSVCLSASSNPSSLYLAPALVTFRAHQHAPGSGED